MAVDGVGAGAAGTPPSLKAKYMPDDLPAGLKSVNGQMTPISLTSALPTPVATPSPSKAPSLVGDGEDDMPSLEESKRRAELRKLEEERLICSLENKEACLSTSFLWARLSFCRAVLTFALW